MIPYNAVETNDAEAVMPWTNIGLVRRFSMPTRVQQIEAYHAQLA